MTTVAVTDPYLLEYPSLSYRLAPEGGLATLDLGTGAGSAPESLTLHGRAWTLRYTDTDVELDDPDEGVSIERVVAVYDEYLPAAEFLLNADSDALRGLIAPLVSGTTLFDDPEGGADLLDGAATFIQRVNYGLRYSYSSGWLSDGTGTEKGKADLLAGRPLAAFLDNLLADATDWGDLAQRLRTVQLAPLVGADGATRLIDLTDHESPRSPVAGATLDLLSPWSERSHARDFDLEKIRCYYWPGGDDDYQQSPSAGAAERVVDDLAHDWGHANVEVLLQRERLKQLHTRASASVPTLPSPPVDLYEVISYRGRYWRVMEIDAAFGETEAISRLTMMAIGAAAEDDGE